jgi:hypothetical protein
VNLLPAACPFIEEGWYSSKARCALRMAIHPAGTAGSAESQSGGSISGLHSGVWLPF